MTPSTNSDKSRALVFSLVALALSGLASAGRLFSLLFFYDRIGYYQSGAFLPIASNILFAASVLFFGVAAIFLIKPSKVIATPTGSTRYVSLVPALALAIYVVSSLGHIVTPEPDTISTISIILAIIGAVFFASLAFCRQPSVITVLTGIGAIFWLAIAWLRSYRDFTIPMNSPDKLFFHLGCLGATLFIFSEIRAMYGLPRPRFYYFSIYTAILTLAVSSIPSLIGNACNTFASYSLQFEDIFFLSLFFYAVVRLLTIVSGNTDEAVSQDKNEESTEEKPVE
jgi:hypothetical protein